jgi:alpha-N-arabinofuranosidase
MAPSSSVLPYFTIFEERSTSHDVHLSWDEWNVWYRARSGNGMVDKWAEAPHLLEEVYNLEDALVVAQWMNVFLRKSNFLKIACLAQIVNVIAPLMTTRDAVLRQSIFYPLALFSRLASGSALDVLVKAPLYYTARFGDVPLLDVSASYDEARNTSAIFIVNRSQTESIVIDLKWQDLAPQSLVEAHQVTGTDPKAANSFENPYAVTSRRIETPTLDGKKAMLVVPPLSFTAIDAKM